MEMVKCPFCAEEIQPEAKKCKHCGEFLDRPSSPSASSGPTARLPDGTPVVLRVLDTVSSETSVPGDHFGLKLEQDLRAGKFVFAKVGAHAAGSVSHAKKAGMLSKGGELNVRVEHLKVGDVRVPLRGTGARQGASKGVVSWVMWGGLNLVRKGKNVEIPAGTVMTAYVDDDVMLPATEEKWFCTKCGGESVWPDELCAACANAAPATTPIKWRSIFAIGIAVLGIVTLLVLLVLSSNESQPGGAAQPTRVTSAAPVAVQTPPPVPKYRLFKFAADRPVVYVVPVNTTDEQLKSLLWFFRKSVRSGEFKKIGITRATGPSGYTAGMLTIYRGEKCANEQFFSDAGACGPGDHDAAYYQWGIDGNPAKDSGAIRTKSGQDVSVFKQQ